MEEKKHVGRPTNEEVASRKKKKVVKYSLITVISILLVGGIALFLNRDNIDFSSLMGASIFKRYNYVVNHYDGGSYISIDQKNVISLTNSSSCKVILGSNKATCEIKPMAGSPESGITGYGLVVYAKKKGNVTVRVTGKNKRGKTSSKNIRIKISNDIQPPVCEISAPATVKRNSELVATVTCNENVTFTEEGERYNNTSGFSAKYNSVLKNQKCKTFNYYYSYIQRVEKINNKTYKLYHYIPKDACLTNDLRLVVFNNTFKDSAGNISFAELESKPLSIK